MKVLIACEYSGVSRRAFQALGHDVWSADFEPAEDGAKNHYQGDCFDLINNQHFDLMIAHPPCTYMANSGVVWLHKDPARWKLLDEAAAFFLKLWNAPIKRKCVENPIMHKYAKERIGGLRQSQVIQPWMFGHLEQKATCLWLQELPLLMPTNDVKSEMLLLQKRERERLHYLPPSPTRWKERSRTYPGIATAFAQQWGCLT